MPRAGNVMRCMRLVQKACLVKCRCNLHAAIK